ncbi:MAG: hypothetical protein P8Z00_16360 [Anaerolineales bacterium]
MYPNFEINFLYKEQQYEDLIRQIQLENEARRAYRDGANANGRRPREQRSRFALITNGLNAITRVFNRRTAKAARPDHCPEPCLAS